jgi:hypothetical protein
MRAHRLVAALLLMQSRGRVTAAELAEELRYRWPLRAATSTRCPLQVSPSTRSLAALAGGRYSVARARCL